eukprot:CAMPEP_0113501406 /NCGR_PEP_ID=MMETSP0014_2-20120614/32938_1 /TAXON_ID=2857 /ORGANISM="Nitzschia sp." /LENGTH=246 /DNA_ID=CAMNT_0000395993 /DNA_START=151 /DNA_END=891 /DNA_ORIENTATION=- /assembly_acc=CAM_ASM_000159
MPGFFSQGLSPCHRPSGNIITTTTTTTTTTAFLVGHRQRRIRQRRQQHNPSSSSSSYGDSSNSSKSCSSSSSSKASSTQQQRCNGSFSLARTRVAGTMDLLGLVPPPSSKKNERQNNNNNGVAHNKKKKNPKTLESSVSSLTADTAKTSSSTSTSTSTSTTATTTAAAAAAAATATRSSNWWSLPSPEQSPQVQSPQAPYYSPSVITCFDCDDDRDDHNRPRRHHVRDLSADWGYFVDCTTTRLID